MTESFVMYRSFHEALSELTREQYGNVMFAINEYALNGTEIELSGIEKAIFLMAKPQLEKDGKKIENHKERNCSKYKDWRKAVFERDNYTCQMCKKRGGELNAHHIERFAKNKEKRFCIDNGITLCKTCHRALHKKEGK